MAILLNGVELFDQLWLSDIMDHLRATFLNLDQWFRICGLKTFYILSSGSPSIQLNETSQ